MAEPNIIYTINPKTPNNLLLFLLMLVCVLIAIILFKDCSSKPNIIPSNQLAKDTIYKLQIKIDSIDVERIKYVSKWRILRDTINITDTIQVIAALNKCDTIIKIDSTEIASLQLINRKLYRVVKSDSLVIDSLTRSKKKYWRGFKHGLIIGAVGVELINVGAKVVPMLK